MYNFILKNKIILSFVVFLACILLNSVFIFRNPWYDWDIVCYTWIVKMIDNPNLKEVHKDTYRELRKELPQDRYDVTKMANKYRREVFNNPQTFYDQFPFYTIKFIYSYSIYTIHKFIWISVVNSIIAVSIISYIIVAVLLFVLFIPEINKSVLFIVPLYLFMSFWQMLIWWRSTTPDMIWVLFLFVWTLLVLKKQIIPGLIVLIISLGTRTDNIIYIVFLLWYLKFFASKEYKINYLTFIWFWLLTWVTYKFINMYFDNFWYVKLFYHSFIDQIYHPATDVINVSYHDYFNVFKNKLRVMLSLEWNRPESFLFVYVLMWIIFSVYARTKKIFLDNIYIWIIYLSIATLIVKFILFPNIQERYFIFYFLIIFISIVKILFSDVVKEEEKILE